MKNRGNGSSRASRLAAALCVGIIILLTASAILAAGSGEYRPLMRFPDIHKDTVVFVYGEDIWSAPTAGGVARRLTIHDGAERYPRISPNGKLVAFTGQYDGNSDVYVMNIDGGEIRRVTYHPGDDEVLGWHPTKGKILFASSRNSYNRFSRLFLISPDGSGLEELPLPEAATGSFSPDGKQIAYTRVTTEPRTWKRYRGGLAPEVWIYDFGTLKERKITPFEGGGRLPIWLGDTVYFSSDRNRTINLYAFDTKTTSVTQVTRFNEYDARRPSGSGKDIVCENGGEIWRFDTVSGKSVKIPIEIRADAPEVRSTRVKVADLLTSVDVSPTGVRAVVVARGDVFTVPKKDGPIRNLTQSSGAHDKDAVWSPDGARIAYLSDVSGEYEIYVIDAMGKGEAVRLTQSKDGYRYHLRWSPDSKKIAYADQTLSFYVLDVENKQVVTVDKAEYEPQDVGIDAKAISDFVWSPDSRYIAYSKMDANLVQKVFIYDLQSKTSTCVSNGIFNDFEPAFSRDGKYLFFVSNRRFDPTFCDFEWEMVYKKVAGIYCLTLAKDGAPLLPDQSDEEVVKGKADKTADKAKGEEKVKPADDKAAGEEKKTATVIDFAGLVDRIQALPLPGGNYRKLIAGDGVLFYQNADDGDFNRMDLRGTPAMDLYAFSFKDKSAKSVVKGIDAYTLSADGATIAFRKGSTAGLLESSARDAKPDGFDLSGLVVELDPVAEWKQIFNEAWRMERDYYYDPNMHGLDWVAIGERYRKLVPFASCRQDIEYIIGELIGELNTSHTYVFGGDVRRKTDPVSVGMLGADWQLDEAARLYRLKKIYKVAEWTRPLVPPLAAPGVNAREGDYILRVNGTSIDPKREIYAAFQGLAGTPVMLTLNDKPSMDGAREVQVKPASGEGTLRYQDWIEHNRQVVDQASGGRIGYIHMPDTFTGSATEFPKYFYAQTQKDGIILDGRYNGGGLDPDIFLQRLAKRPVWYWTRRYSHDQASPMVSTSAHMVCLTNRQAGSGGDMLPAEFRELGFGPIVGTRTWGGLVGVSMFISLVDGGGLTAPDYRIYNRKGTWVVENEGVTPDYEVELEGADMATGRDAQLAKAIELLLAKIKAEPRPSPKHQAFPVDR